jgi:hypothetical protein
MPKLWVVRYFHRSEHRKLHPTRLRFNGRRIRDWYVRDLNRLQTRRLRRFEQEIH